MCIPLRRFIHFAAIAIAAVGILSCISDSDSIWSPFETRSKPEIQTADVPGLSPDLDANAALALRRLNFYRISVGLVPYRYDAGLSRMAQAHVKYVLAGNGYGGHFETSGRPGYSKEGDEAARTSGLGFGARDPLDALEALIALPYHRAQFMRTSETRVGVGFGRSGDYSIGLFVTRPEEAKGDSTADSKAPRFILFPPPGIQGIGTRFPPGETPDPRPGFEAQDWSSRRTTGYPITISLGWDDTDKFSRSTVAVTDGSGARVDVWVTDPAHPSNAKAPNIYAAGVSAGDYFAHNFNSVFIMPKEPLKALTKYTVDATILIGSESLHLNWSFTTRQESIWG